MKSVILAEKVFAAPLKRWRVFGVVPKLREPLANFIALWNRSKIGLRDFVFRVDPLLDLFGFTHVLLKPAVRVRHFYAVKGVVDRLSACLWILGFFG